MPLYDFQCEKCNQILEIKLPLSDLDKKQFCTCEEGAELKQLISRTGLNFVGSWYTTTKEY